MCLARSRRSLARNDRTRAFKDGSFTPRRRLRPVRASPRRLCVRRDPAGNHRHRGGTSRRCSASVRHLPECPGRCSASVRHPLRQGRAGESRDLLDATIGVDAGCKSARLTLAKWIPVRNELSGGAFLSGELAKVEAAAVACVEASRQVARRSLAWGRWPRRVRR